MQMRVEQDKSKIGTCGCGRSPIGKCIGWHGLTESAYKAKLAEYIAKNPVPVNEQTR
jgi:hypothetical protein